MENELICLDTSILIDYFRKTNKENSFLAKLIRSYSLFAVSIITEFEIYCGSTEEQTKFWDEFFQNITILPFDGNANSEAISIYKALKKEGNLIEIPDLFIGATAKAHRLKIATLNQKHFKKIKGLELVEI